MNKAGQIVTFRKYGLGLTIVWTCILAAFLAFIIHEYHKLVGGFALLWIMGVAGITVSSTRRHQQEMTLREYTVKLESEVTERRRIQGELEDQALRLEEEISERRVTQEQLEEQAILLEEENTERQAAVSALHKA
jgi:hypothetical protein